MPSHPPKSALNVVSDSPDFRDRYYEPTLAALRDELPPPDDLYILNQGQEGACTGFGLAATINLMYKKQRKDFTVSARMLYEMARRYDEWPGEDYEGSSCRGAIKGWKNSGVCLEKLCPYIPHADNFVIDQEISQDARGRTIGAYYRLRPDIAEVHAAINETGVVYTSAAVHQGWFETAEDAAGIPVIPRHENSIGGHAFALVGYNNRGFWIQNSWGKSWGRDGLALWLYEDWAENVKDAWVVQLALPTPQIFDSRFNAGLGSSANRGATYGSVPRVAIEEHFVHLDDGQYHDKGRYWSNQNHMTLVQKNLGASACEHVLFYAHGGLNSVKASARRIAAMKQVFLDNNIYPFHFMYDTGLFEEAKDVLLGKRKSADQITGGISEWFDRRVENLTRKPGRALWREMKHGACLPFAKVKADGSDVLRRLIGTIATLDPKAGFHVAGHSTGAVLQAYLLDRAIKLFPELSFDSCTLMAPAATNKLFDKLYRPLLKENRIKEMAIYNLTDKLEQDDNVVEVYGKSLLYLVSRAFEEEENTPLLGMQKYNRQLDVTDLPVEFIYSKGGQSGRTISTSHGGFDNDPFTMNDMLKRILGKDPARPFTEKELNYEKGTGPPQPFHQRKKE
jgi:hypothetical protein